MEIYLEPALLKNTILTFLLIKAVALMRGKKVSNKRLTIVLLVSNLYLLINLFWYLAQTGLNKLFINFFAAISMTLIAFKFKSWRNFLTDISYLYLISFTGVGLLTVYQNLLVAMPKSVKISFWPVLILLIIFVKAGQKYWTSVLPVRHDLLELEIILKDKKLQIKGLLDTGNQLTDPQTGFPVIIVEARKIFSENEIDQQQLARKDISKLCFEHHYLESFSLIPYADLGQETGLLVGFCPKEVKFIYQQQKFSCKKVKLGLVDKKLSKKNKFSAIINPELLK